MVKIGTEVKIDAAHFLPGYDGPCGLIHGHTWRIVVEVEGTVDNTGMVVDFTQIKKLISNYDHDFFNKTQKHNVNLIENPTAENIAEVFCYGIFCLSENIQKVVVRVYESAVSYAEVEKER